MKKIGIIGGGISGAALGYYLSLYSGEAEVTIFEKDRIGCGTTASPPAPCACSTTL